MTTLLQRLIEKHQNLAETIPQLRAKISSALKDGATNSISFYYNDHDVTIGLTSKGIRTVVERNKQHCSISAGMEIAIYQHLLREVAGD